MSTHFADRHQPAIQLVQLRERRLARDPERGRKQEQAAHPVVAQALVDAQRGAGGVSRQIDFIGLFGKPGGEKGCRLHPGPWKREGLCPIRQSEGGVRERDLYLTVYDFMGRYPAHGANPQMVGKNLLGLIDRFAARAGSLARELL